MVSLPKWQGLDENPPSEWSGDVRSAAEVFRVASKSVYLLLSGDSFELIADGQGSQGSAVAISETLAVTNCHVIEDGRAQVLVDDVLDTVVEVFVRAADSKTDRCIIEARGTLRPMASTRTLDSIEIGEPVYAIGNPSGLSKTLTEGIVSGVRKDGTIQLIQTSAPISPGSSGGALVDGSGALVGITTSFLKDAQNLNFAIAAEDYWRD